MVKDILEQFKYLMADLKRWKCSSLKDVFYHFFEQGLWATVFYRLARALFLVNIPIIKIILRLISFFLLKFSEYFLGAAIKPEANIGPGLYIGHVGLIRVHPKVKVGKNLNIGPGVIIGQKGLGVQGIPVIGDNVYIGSGAKIFGDITLGSNAKIGANAVVLSNVPDGATAVGVPAKIVKRNQ